MELPIYHIIPLGDLKEHEESVFCECNPEVDFDGRLIIHNSFDGREAVEWAKKLLDNLNNN